MLKESNMTIEVGKKKEPKIKWKTKLNEIPSAKCIKYKPPFIRINCPDMLKALADVGFENAMQLHRASRVSAHYCRQIWQERIGTFGEEQLKSIVLALEKGNEEYKVKTPMSVTEIRDHFNKKGN